MTRLARWLAALLMLAAATAVSAAEPQRILFIGNSFTMGANSAAERYGADTVTDLNGGKVGGVPAIFAAFARQAGLDWQVSHELVGGTTLGFHLNEKRALIDAPWDAVVLQQYSTLDPKRPGDPASTLADAPALARLFTAQNPKVQLYLTSTWTRADQALVPGGHWYGRPPDAMASDLRRAMDRARATSPAFVAVLPVGEAWQRAIDAGIADPNPYDGRAYRQIDLWSWDHYHASAEGYYLEALVVFGRVTGYDVTKLGAGEEAGRALGIEPRVMEALQRVAHEQLAR